MMHIARLNLTGELAAVAGANYGGLMFWVDGTQIADLAGVDNDTRRVDQVHQVRLGATSGIDAPAAFTFLMPLSRAA